MSNSKLLGSARKRSVDSSRLPKIDVEQDDLDVDLSSDIKGIMSALHQIKEKAKKDGQKKNEETITSVASEIRSIMDDLKNKIEKERQNLAKALSKSSKECDDCLKAESARFQENYQKFCKQKETHLQSMKEAISKFEENKEKLFIRYEQQRKREKTMISEQEKVCGDKIASLESSLKKKKKDDKTFSLLRKTLGTFLEPASDEDLLLDD